MAIFVLFYRAVLIRDKAPVKTKCNIGILTFVYQEERLHTAQILARQIWCYKEKRQSLLYCLQIVAKFIYNLEVVHAW